MKGKPCQNKVSNGKKNCGKCRINMPYYNKISIVKSNLMDADDSSYEAYAIKGTLPIQKEVALLLSGFSDKHIQFKTKEQLLNNLSNFGIDLRDLDRERKDWGSGLNEMQSIVGFVSQWDEKPLEELKNRIKEARDLALAAPPLETLEPLTKLSYEEKKYYE